MPRTYANIPGTFITYRDGNLVIPELVRSTDNMTIIDSALWGPVAEPVTVTTLEAGQAIFGRVNGAYGDINRLKGYNGNSLMKSAAEALQAGSRNLTLVRMDCGGTVAKTTLFFKVNADDTVDTITAKVTTAGTDAIGAIIDLSTVATDADARTGLLAELQVGHACWKSGAASTIFRVAAVDKTNAAWKVILEPSSDEVALDEDEDTSEWVFAAGITLSGAYPGAVANTIKFKIDRSGTSDDNYTTNFRIKLPAEFGGYSFAYNSLYYSTLAALAARVNTDLRDVLTLTLDYATGDESFGYGVTNVIAGVVENANDTVIADADNAEGETSDELDRTILADITNPTKDKYYRIGEALTLAGSLVNSAVTAGTDFGTLSGIQKNPALFSIGADRRHEMYASILGNVLAPADDNKTLPLLRGQNIGVLVVPGLYLDDMADKTSGEVRHLDADGKVAAAAGTAAVPFKNALQFLLDFCHQQNLDGISTSLVIGCSPLRATALSEINARAAFLAKISFMAGELKNRDGESDLVDAGRYLSVVGGPHVLVSDRELGTYVASGAIQYAALLTALSAAIPPSQKTVGGIIGVGYRFTRRQMSDLSGGQGARSAGGAYVIIDVSGTAPVVNLAVTAAARKSDYAKIHNFRVANAAGAAVRSAIRPFLGNAFGIEQYNAMYTSIQSALDTLVDNAVIYGGKGVGYDFLITQALGDALLNQAHVSLSVRPNFELDWVDVDVKLRV